MSIPQDQYGSPTSAKDLARLILHLIHTNEYGTYHATCKGVCSRYEFAQEILRQAGLQGQLCPGATDEADHYLARPAYAVLDNFILRIIDLYAMPVWQASLAKYLEEREG